VIGRISGKLAAKQPPWLCVDVGGVGYELEAPMSTFYGLPAVGQSVSLHTHLVVREDAHLLYGFATVAERVLFRELIRVSGVGPRIAMAVLSGISVDEFWFTVRAGDVTKLTRLPGVGKRTAERIVVETRDRAAADTVADGRASTAGAATPLEEARGALLALGYKPAEVQKFTEAAYRDGMDAEGIIREALKRAVR
jgi:holliday junction DNA helicase RuvA